MWERETVGECVCERECVPERVSARVCVCERECMRERVCARERVCVREIVCARECACERGMHSCQLSLLRDADAGFLRFEIFVGISTLFV